MKRFGNYLHMTASIIILIFVLMENNKHAEHWIQGILLFVLVILFHRSFNYLVVFSIFTTVVKMINKIIVKLYPFFLVLFWFYITTVLLFIYIDKDNHVIPHIRDSYYWVLFGNIDASAFENELSFIPVLFGTIIIGVFLLNILVAYMSNEFSRLEKQQIIDTWKEKAELNAHLGMIIYCLRNLFKVNFFRGFSKQNFKYQQLRKQFDYLNHKELFQTTASQNAKVSLDRILTYYSRNKILT